MANEIAVTPADIRPLTGAVIRRAIASGALALGDAVYVMGAAGPNSDTPRVAKAVGTAVASAFAFGVVVAASAGNPGAVAVADGEVCDVVVMGPVAGYSSMTPGGNIWVSDTAGRLSSVVGTKSGVIGIAESANIAFIRPGLYVVST